MALCPDAPPAPRCWASAPFQPAPTPAAGIQALRSGHAEREHSHRRSPLPELRGLPQWFIWTPPERHWPVTALTPTHGDAPLAKPPLGFCPGCWDRALRTAGPQGANRPQPCDPPPTTSTPTGPGQLLGPPPGETEAELVASPQPGSEGMPSAHIPWSRCLLDSASDAHPRGTRPRGGQMAPQEDGGNARAPVHEKKAPLPWERRTP